MREPVAVESTKPPRLLRQPEVIRRTGLKPTQIFEAERRGLFPRSRKIVAGGRAKAWLESEIDHFVLTGEVLGAPAPAPSDTPTKSRKTRGKAGALLS